MDTNVAHPGQTDVSAYPALTAAPALPVLRDYQLKMVADTRAARAACKGNVLVVAPTGAGKTLFLAEVSRSARIKSRRVLVLAHRRELIRQASKKLTAAGVKHGIIAPGHPITDDLVQVGSVQTVVNRSGWIAAGYDLIIVDEAHHSVAGAWRRIIEANPHAMILGVTASPARTDARWSVVGDSLHVLMVGVYPDHDLWRVWVAASLLAILLGTTLGLAFPWRVSRAPAAVLLAVAAVVLMSLGIAGGVVPAVLAALVLIAWVVATGRSRLGPWMIPGWLLAVIAAFALVSQPGLDLWGGLMLSIMLTIVASVATLPLGILLAFGRRSRIPSVRICCTGYIEVMRSVPLILVVYCIWITVPLLVPNYPVPGLVRGMVGYALFYSAYVAEYVRSGLQAVARGQVEAARSLGMGSWTVNTEIVLPQAIRVTLPALVGNVLDIFNGATLVFILGLTDFLRAGQMILADPRHSGQIYEVYAFMFVVYFATGSLITLASRKLEAHLARGAR